jgi:hypothetical protein
VFRHVLDDGTDPQTVTASEPPGDDRRKVLFIDNACPENVIEVVVEAGD